MLRGDVLFIDFYATENIVTCVYSQWYSALIGRQWYVAWFGARVRMCL